jgi:hypothetical protein
LLISGNSSLISLAGLDNLEYLGGLQFGHSGEWGSYGNPSLADLTGLESIDPGSIQDMYISYNNYLSECAVKSICDCLASPNGAVEIHDNAYGCDSQWQVEEECLVEVEEVGSQQSAVSSRQSAVIRIPPRAFCISHFAFRSINM